MDADALLTATEATTYLKLKQRTRIFEIARRYGLGRQVGDTWYFTKRELDAYREARRRLPATARRMQGVRVAVPPDPARDALDRGDVIDINAAAAILEVSVQRVYELARLGRIGTRHGARWLFTRAEVETQKATRNPRGGRPRKTPRDDV